MIRIEFRRYRRPFRQPLRTAHGVWTEREGVVLQLTDSGGQTAWGEIAPLPWFGSESLEAVLHFLQQCPAHVESQDEITIPNCLPATQFGWESAWEGLGQPGPPADLPLPHCLLLPTGKPALTAWRALRHRGGGTLKWKIGTAPIQDELYWFEQLMNEVPPEVRLRLDANGGLTLPATRCWLEVCDRFANVEFLEQPLPPSQLDTLLLLQQDYATPLALDESVATLEQLEAVYERGWRGIVVIKAAIAGSPSRLRQFCQQSGLDRVWSSVLETPIARTYLTTCLIPSMSPVKRALGFGVEHWFADAWSGWTGDRLWQFLGAQRHAPSPAD